MNQSTILFGTALLATLVVLATLAGGVTAATEPAAAPQVAANETTANATTTNATAPGAQLAGVVGVQQAEVDGDLDNRTFGLRVANADSDEERAAIIAERQTETRERLATQRDRFADLRAARANGTISDAEYRGRVATVAAESANTERDAEQLNRSARDLPPAVRERNNITFTAIERLRADARTLGGPKTAAIARSIGGTTARNPMAGGPRGPGMDMPGLSQDRGGQQAGPTGERGGSDTRNGAGQEADDPQNQGGQDRTGASAGDSSGDNSDDRRGSSNNQNTDSGSGNGGNTGGSPNQP